MPLLAKSRSADLMIVPRVSALVAWAAEVVVMVRPLFLARGRH